MNLVRSSIIYCSPASKENPMRKPILALVLFLATTALFAATAGSVYDFTIKSIDGQPVSLKSYNGKVVLLVNVASKCGFTPQYAGLEAL
jgi:glutathione peroxidase